MMSTVYSVDLISPKPNKVCQRCARKQTQANILSRVEKKNSNSDTAQKVEKTPSDLIYLIPFYRSLRQDEKWKELRKKLDQDQAKKIVQWINNNLANSYRITNLYIDLSDGLRVAYLLEVLYNCHLNKESPITRLHRMKNFQTCIDFMEFSRQVKCVGINSTELVEGNLKILLGFLFLIRHDYEYKYCREILTMSNECISELKTVPLIGSKNDDKIQKIVQNSEIKDKLERVDSLPQYQESLKSRSKSSIFSSDLDDNKSVERDRNVSSYRLVNGSYDSLESDDKFSNIKSGLSSKSMSDIESIPNSSQTDSLVDLMSHIQKVSAEMTNKLDNCLKEVSNSEESIDIEDDDYSNSELSKFEETMKENNNGFNETEIFEHEGSAESTEPKDYFTKSSLFETKEMNKIPSQHENIVNTNLFIIKNKNNSNSNEQIVPEVEESFENDDQVLPIRNNPSDDEMMEKNDFFHIKQQSIISNFSEESILEKESATKKLDVKNEHSSEDLNKKTCEAIEKNIQELNDLKKELKVEIEFENSKENGETNEDIKKASLEIVSLNLVKNSEEKLNGEAMLSNIFQEDANNGKNAKEEIESEKCRNNKEINEDLTDPSTSASSNLTSAPHENLNGEATLSNNFQEEANNEQNAKEEIESEKCRNNKEINEDLTYPLTSASSNLPSTPHENLNGEAMLSNNFQEDANNRQNVKEEIESEKSRNNKEIHEDLNDPLTSAISNLPSTPHENLNGEAMLSTNFQEEANNEQNVKEEIEYEKSMNNKEINVDTNDSFVIISACLSLIDNSEPILNGEDFLSQNNLKNLKENMADDKHSSCDFNYQNNNDKIEKIFLEKDQILDEGNILECVTDVRKEDNEKSFKSLSEKDKSFKDFNQVIERQHQNFSNNDQKFAEKFSSDCPQYNENVFEIESMIDSLIEEVCELSYLDGNIYPKILSEDLAKINPDDQSNQSKFIIHEIQEILDKKNADPKSTKFNSDEINCENDNLTESMLKFDEGTSKNNENIDQEPFQDEINSDIQTSPKVDLDVRIDQQKDSDTVYQSFPENVIQADHIILDLNKEEKCNYTNLNEKLPGMDQVNDISVENSSEHINEQAILENDDNSCVNIITDQNSESNEEGSNETVQNDNDKKMNIIDRIISEDNENVKLLTTIDTSIDQNEHEFSQNITDEKNSTDCLSSQENLNQIESLKLNGFTLNVLNNLSDLDHNSVSKHFKDENENLISNVEKNFVNEILDESIDKKEEQKKDNLITEIEVMPKNNITYSNSEHSKKTYSSIVQQNYNENPLEKNRTRSNGNEKLEQKNFGHIKYKLKSNSASKQDFSKSKIKNITNKPVYEENKLSSKPLVKKLDSEADRSVETKNKFKELDNIDLQSSLENDLKSPIFLKSYGTNNGIGNKSKSIRKKNKINSIIFSQSDDFKTPCKTLEFFKIFILTIVFITFSIVINYYISS